ncbi:hypothetical protein GUITHDRAFT_120061 [Guillardia theta CCMP2712]|uniref:Uncharacterized protein n=1 Tax=Guillardia theta (strain CCMP2712) TaxID=905079 RepID=L1IBW0_GUITC|nr:hypothetical protein GUITHDRAFT_120061 [Guillardia theta CCMP2712]EKX33731.1 hypothetical protein GUITHDRAFT_120061 [Guillardia theta CCMP2712]|eukprot:XP_005820711.1 hypothetical protein GUITHDRAFT_120061 [Guillardia theta CCMP2712]
MNTSSHDWQRPLSDPQPAPRDLALQARERSWRRLLVAMAVIAAFARLVGDVACWFLEEEDELDEEAPSQMPRQPRRQRSSAKLCGFDKMKMLRPYFGQTFKVSRVGIK